MLAEKLLIPDYTLDGGPIVSESAIPIWKYLSKNYRSLYDFVHPVFLVQQELVDHLTKMSAQKASYKKLTKMLTKLEEYYRKVERVGSYNTWLEYVR